MTRRSHQLLLISWSCHSCTIWPKGCGHLTINPTFVCWKSHSKTLVTDLGLAFAGITVSTLPLTWVLGDQITSGQPRCKDVDTWHYTVYASSVTTYNRISSITAGERLPSVFSLSLHLFSARNVPQIIFYVHVFALSVMRSANEIAAFVFALIVSPLDRKPHLIMVWVNGSQLRHISPSPSAALICSDQPGCMFMSGLYGTHFVHMGSVMLVHVWAKPKQKEDRCVLPTL